MRINAFDMVVDRARNVTDRLGGDEFLGYVQKTYALQHVAYVGFNIPTTAGPSRYFHNTYSNAWRRHYHSENLFDLDPIIQQGLMDLLPHDWEQLAANSVYGTRVMADAHAFDVGHTGMSFPIRGVHGETAIFSVSTKASKSEWSKLSRLLRRDMQVIGHHFHQRILEICGHAPHIGQQSLSTPEIECLKWAAAGKSAWETSKIMTISERTVKFHLSNARYKLQSVNTTQAVAQAMSARLLFLN
jgi:DNA-binding CsgD family transcriptional regulator